MKLINISGETVLLRSVAGGVVDFIPSGKVVAKIDGGEWAERVEAYSVERDDGPHVREVKVTTRALRDDSTSIPRVIGLPEADIEYVSYRIGPCGGTVELGRAKELRHLHGFGDRRVNVRVRVVTHYIVTELVAMACPDRGDLWFVKPDKNGVSDALYSAFQL